MDEWVVVRQDRDGDRFFIDREGHWTPDFFQAVRHSDLPAAMKEADGKGIVMTAREAYQLTVTFNQRSHGLLA